MLVLKDFEFAAAHRLIRGYQGKCAHLHGHTYKVEVALRSNYLDKYGMVIDFEEVKTRMRQLVDTNIDHATIVVPDDKELLEFLVKTRQKHFVLQAGNATAECIAKALLTEFQDAVEDYPLARPDASPELHVAWVRVWETPTSSACASGEEE